MEGCVWVCVWGCVAWVCGVCGWGSWGGRDGYRFVARARVLVGCEGGGRKFEKGVAEVCRPEGPGGARGGEGWDGFERGGAGRGRRGWMGVGAGSALALVGRADRGVDGGFGKI